MLESAVEKRLKDKLESYGFKVIKFVSPGTVGVHDRLILRPKWSPGAPIFCEVKRPGKEPTKLQEAVGLDMFARGCTVVRFVNNYRAVDDLVKNLLEICNRERTDELGEIVADANKLKLGNVT